MGQFTERLRRALRSNPKVYEVQVELFVDNTSAGTLQINTFGRSKSEAKSNAVAQLQQAINIKVLKVNKQGKFNKHIE